MQNKIYTMFSLYYMQAVLVGREIVVTVAKRLLGVFTLVYAVVSIRISE